jgi:hypothetical protein
VNDSHESRLNDLLEAARSAEVKLRDGGAYPIKGETWRALRDALLPYKGLASVVPSESGSTLDTPRLAFICENFMRYDAHAKAWYFNSHLLMGVDKLAAIDHAMYAKEKSRG